MSRFVLVFISILFTLSTEILAAGAIEGYIRDAETLEPLGFATVQIYGTGQSAVANADGRYRINCGAGTQVLKISHIGFFTVFDTVVVGEGAMQHDVQLRPSLVIVSGPTVYSRQFDPAQLIILEAIKRKQEILERLGSYDYNAYTKLVIRDKSKPDSAKIMVITETQSQSFWERPNKYKEIILARRQSANVDAVNNLVSLGEFLNFNKNRFEIGEYAVVSPVADDALKYYNYYLLDSLMIDHRKVYKLEAEPKNQADALVEGYIFIADSTFDVVDVEVGFNDGVRLPFVTDLRYTQRVAQFEDQYWMPVEIKFEATVEIKFPGIPNNIGFEVTASIYNYSFETEHDDVFDEYLLEVDDAADKLDSLAWAARQSIPLSTEEIRGYARIDSVEKAPKPLSKHLLRAGLGAVAVVAFGAPDLFRYNRVEGAYVGLAANDQPLAKGLDLSLKTGYAFTPEQYQYGGGLNYRFPGDLKLTLGAEYHRTIDQLPVINAGRCDATSSSLFFRLDPSNYAYERGGSVSASISPVRHSKLSFSFHDLTYRSLPKGTDKALFEGDEEFRENPPIDDGNLRLFRAGLELDSRKLWRNKGRDFKLEAVQYSVLRIGGEFSSPDLFSSDRDYRRYWASFTRHQRTLGLGVTEIDLFAGSATRELPAQRYYFITDYSEFLAPEESKLLTVGENFFAGNRAAFFYVRHDFGQYLFKKSGLPLIKHLPFTLGVHGGAFWSEFKNHMGNVDTGYKTATGPYREIGFSLGNLTPFLSVLNFATYLTWQISDYDTNDFTARIGIKF